MKVLADQYLYMLDELLPDGVECVRFNPDNGFPEQAIAFDALLIRTVTTIHPETLQEAGKLNFIGSATAGFDHVDTGHLNNLGVAFAWSEGCNANAVGEYVITVLYRWARTRGIDLSRKKIGVVGCGNTGGSVIHYLKKPGIKTVLYDPPKTEREPGFVSAGLDELLSCDILTFHTPLTHSEKHSTAHLCGTDWMESGFDLIINASRGGVVDEQALLKAHAIGKTGDFILDVWEGEPVFSDEAAEKACIATPHVAGYSKEAKWKASELVVQKMCRFFGLKWKQPTLISHKKERGLTSYKDMSFADFLWQNSNVKYYNTELRNLIGLNNHEKALAFARLRSETEMRIEFETLIKQINRAQNLPKEVEIFF